MKATKLHLRGGFPTFPALKILYRIAILLAKSVPNVVSLA
jgi:hypothetical protein